VHDEKGRVGRLCWQDVFASFRHRSSTIQPASALTIQEVVTIAEFHLSGDEHMRTLTVRILAITGIVAAGGAFALWADTGAAEAEAESVLASTPTAITELPLDRGYYVRTDATCATASNATAALLRRQGLYWDGSFCSFHGIEQTGPNTFRVKQFCSDPRAPEPPTPIPADWLVTAEWVIKDRASFSFKDSEGWEHEARLCAQQSMPADYSRNNIAELIK
jgi:hypothetical protein